NPYPPLLPGPLERARPHRTPIWLWILTLGLLAVLIVLQRPEQEKPDAAAQRAAGLGAIKPPEADPFVLIAKLTLAMRDLMRQAAAGGSSPTSLSGDDPVVAIVEISDGVAGWSGANRFRPASASNPPKHTDHPEAAADRLHAAIIAAEVLPPDELEWRIHDIEKDLDPASPLNTDARIVRAVYGLSPPLPRASGGGAERSEAEGAVRPDSNSPDNPPEQDAGAIVESTSPAPPIKSHTPTTEELAAAQSAIAALDQSDKDAFKSRHGWFADLVLSRGESPATLRESAAAQGFTLIILLCLLLVGLFIAGLTGLVLLIIAAVRAFSGTLTWRFARPNPAREWPLHPDTGEGAHNSVMLATPGSVWLETVAVFFAMFLAVKGVSWGLEKSGVSKDTVIAGSLFAQWLVLLAIFWPILRGMPLARWKNEIGWTSNRGVLREVGAGVVGYLAGLPVYFGVAVIVVIITLIVGYFTGAEPRPGGNRLTDVLEGGSAFQLFLIFTLATIWAPIVEESIFRGCLFRHLRRRTGLVLAALGSAAVFAALHGYVVQGLFMVGALGVWFALMREWRGNIIATATAHALHNGVVMTIMLIALAFARG
ncbi:MAG TPA: type II CAAX endopeptidase family protein, partial [Phycisphaerales bacterium]|nr:type II CAAX endopeptidase family protein [Phycisphaerales bacterium]